MYILAAQRDKDPVGSFARYREYVEQNRAGYPDGALRLASSDWYFNPEDRRCPHDGWLESVTIVEPSRGDRGEIRSLRIAVRLLGGWHDGHIEMTYSDVIAYDMSVLDAHQGHSDWRYDEFRLGEAGALIHEVEWAAGGRWIIECADVDHRWLPMSSTGGP